MNASDIGQVAYYAGETKAILFFVIFLAVAGWSVAVYMTILYWLQRPRYRNARQNEKAAKEQVMKLLQRIGQQNGELNEAIQLRADAELLKDEFRTLDAKHDIIHANYIELTARAFRYREERNKSDIALKANKKLMQKLIDRISTLTEHIELPVTEVLEHK